MFFSYMKRYIEEWNISNIKNQNNEEKQGEKWRLKSATFLSTLSLNMNFISEESPIFADSENIISHF